MGEIKSWFSRLVRFLLKEVVKRPLLVLVIAASGAAVSLLFTFTHLTFLPNFAGLNDESAAFSQNYAAFVKEFNAQPDILVVAEGPKQAENEAYLDALTERLQNDRIFSRVYDKINLESFRAWALAYPSVNTLKKIQGSIATLKPLLQAVDHGGLTEFWVALPTLSGHASQINSNASGIVQLRQFVDLMTAEADGNKSLSKLEDPFKDFAGFKNTQYITLDNGRYVMMFARPATDGKGNQDMAGSVDAIKKAALLLQGQFPDVQVHLTGEPVMGLDEMQTAKHDISWAGMVSLILCSFIFIIGFGEIKKPVFSVITLLVGASWSLGYITLTIGHLNIFTLSLFPMLVGLAIDFSIQFLARYREEHAKGKSAAEAVTTTYFSTGVGLLTAATTMSLGFLAIAFAQYPGIAELGIATCGSLLLCFLSTMTVLPALVLLDPSQRFRIKAPGETLAMGVKTERALLRHARPILWGAALLTFVFALAARNIHFNHDVLQLQSTNTDSVITELKLIKASGTSSLFAVMEAKNPAEAQNKIEELRALNTVGQIQSPVLFVPLDQKEKFPILRKIKDELRGFEIPTPDGPVDIPKLTAAFQNIHRLILGAHQKIATASSAFDMAQILIFPGLSFVPHQSTETELAQLDGSLGALDESVLLFLKTLSSLPADVARDRLTAFQTSFFESLKQNFDLVKHGIPSKPVQISNLPPDIRGQFVGKTGKILIQIYPSQNIWERPALDRFVSDLRQVDPNVTGSPILIYESTRLILSSYQYAAKIAFLVIVLVALLHFRNVRLTFYTLVPLVAGIFWLMGIMVLTHNEFNPANLLTLPVILGIGVAFGVYVVNRYREEMQASIFSTSTGRAVLLSALTAIAGFASLLGVSHQGLKSLGFTMTIGLSVITFQALVVLPSLLKLSGKRTHRKKSANGPESRKEPAYRYARESAPGLTKFVSRDT